MLKEFILIIILLFIIVFFTYKLIYVHNYFKSYQFEIVSNEIEADLQKYNKMISDTKQALKSKKKLFLEFSNHNKTQYLSRGSFNNAEQDIIKYVSKYFVPANEDNLKKLKEYQDYIKLIKKNQNDLSKEKKSIASFVRKLVPFLVKCDTRLNKKVGIKNYNVPNISVGVLSFDYVSQKGNSKKHIDFKLTDRNISKLINYVEGIVKNKSNKKYQRSLMTKELRERILKRDNYKCQLCGLSRKQEPHLLLEVDHIIPISKGGKTVESNLQTLCWACNRSKGNKQYLHKTQI